MAENKKSIIVYADWIEQFEYFTDEEAGKLIKHFFRYVNDQNPTAPDRFTEMAFIPIKQTLKRDLDKWENTLEGRRKAGKVSAEAKKALKESQQNSTNSTSVDFVNTNSTNSTDSVSVSVSVSDINYKNNLIFNELIISEMWIENTSMQSKQKFIPAEVKKHLKNYNDMINVQFDIKNNKTEYCTHFVNWLNKQEKKTGAKKPSLL